MVVHVWSDEGIRDHPSRTAVIIHRYLFGDLHEKAGAALDQRRPGSLRAEGWGRAGQPRSLRASACARNRARRDATGVPVSVAAAARLARGDALQCVVRMPPVSRHDEPSPAATEKARLTVP